MKKEVVIYRSNGEIEIKLIDGATENEIMELYKPMIEMQLITKIEFLFDPQFTVYLEEGVEYYFNNVDDAIEYAKMHNGYVYDTYNNEEIADYLRSEVM